MADRITVPEMCSALPPDTVEGSEGLGFDPVWRTSTVLALARGIEAERAFERLPILADALEDAGCGNRTFLEHCRSTAPHCPDCWVLRLVLEPVPDEPTPPSVQEPPRDSPRVYPAPGVGGGHPDRLAFALLLGLGLILVKAGVRHFEDNQPVDRVKPVPDYKPAFDQVRQPPWDGRFEPWQPGRPTGIGDERSVPVPPDLGFPTAPTGKRTEKPYPLLGRETNGPGYPLLTTPTRR